MNCDITICKFNSKKACTTTTENLFPILYKKTHDFIRGQKMATILAISEYTMSADDFTIFEGRGFTDSELQAIYAFSNDRMQKILALELLKTRGVAEQPNAPSVA